MYSENVTRKTAYLITLLVILVGSLFPLSQIYAKETELAVVSVAGLNLRAGPSLTDEILTVLPRGERLEVLDRSDDALWTKVSLDDGTQGWVYNQYIVPLKEGNSQVLLEGLRLRAGPGFAYRTYRELSKGQALTLIGRSLRNDWLLAQLPNGVTGWVFTPYVLSDTNINDLPVAEASGGPDGSTRPEPQTKVVVSIQDNRAFVDITGFPASQEISVYLGLPGKSPDIKVATGLTKADGFAALSFSMPEAWSDGKPITQDNLALKVNATDGSASLTIPIVYIRY